jgi:hypothetical protein
MDEKTSNFAGRRAIRERAAKLYSVAKAAFKDKSDQSSNIDNYWDIYNCKLTDKQMYDGDSAVFVPVVRDGIEAGVTRGTSMLMPSNSKTIDVISQVNTIPYDTIAILEHYIRHCDMRTLLPGVLRTGSVEGQWSLMLGWERKTRKTRRKVERADPENPTEEIEDIEEVKIVTEGPTVEVLPAQDLAVWPATASSIEAAEGVAVIRRYSESKMEDMVDSGVFLKEAFDRMVAGTKDTKNPGKERASEAGVQMKGGTKFYQVYMVFAQLKLDGEREPAVVYLGGNDIVLGVERNPYWSGKVPILSEPKNLIPGSFWGKSDIAHVEQLQYQCNDAINMGMDSAKYSVLPIVMTDPVKNPKVGSMILAAAAIWETNPNDTQFAQFPALWKDALALVSATKGQIMESMGVNDAMLGRAPAGRKNAQAIAQQEASAIATIADPVRRFESGILDKLLEWFFELDQQFRDDDLLIKTEGGVGLGAQIQKVPPQAINERYFFKWNGVEQAMGAQRVQQMISFMNVLRGIPPQMLNGRTLDITPIIDYSALVMFGPNVAPKVILDTRDKVTLDPAMEDEIMSNGIDLPVSPMDDDVAHIKDHQEAAAQTGDLAGHIRKHITRHVAQMNAKAAAAAPPSPAPQKGLPGMPGLGGPGVAGTPRPGAQPVGPRGGAQNPAGAIPQDQMQDASAGGRG